MDNGEQVVFKFLYKIIEREIGGNKEDAEKVTKQILKLDQAELSKLCSDADLMLGKISECKAKLG